MKKMFAALVILLLALPAFAGEFSLLAGATRFGEPSDGTYWNKNQQHDFSGLNQIAYGARWESDRLPFNTAISVQYTNFGESKTNALAVTVDAPYPGGYIPESGGQCVGTCAPLARWVMRGEAQSVSLGINKYFGNFGIEWAAAFSETRTTGYVDNLDGSRRYTYASGHGLEMNEMFGVSYHKGPWSVRLQSWKLMGRSGMVNGVEQAPYISNDERTTTLLVGYAF